jgi:hypothetical protein
MHYIEIILSILNKEIDKSQWMNLFLWYSMKADSYNFAYNIAHPF